ncbi:MAG: hypothetical protein KF832_18065 [Caldilineaceae bacterium]|nr:hypothetical protein [Caldilineaceae bacterium]
MSIEILRLLHLADSAFPIGATAHSFGLETLTAEGHLTPQKLQRVLHDLLWESGQGEALFTRLAYRCAAAQASREAGTMEAALPGWLELNQWVAAWKPAREGREASATLGRRFLQTVAHLEAAPVLQQAMTTASQAGIAVHYCAAFGLVGGALTLGEETTILAYLQQTVMGLISACLRLLPLGQSRASEILWKLKPTMAEVAAASLAISQTQPALGSTPETALTHAFGQLAMCTPMLDLASMRHPTLTTRLFIS